MELEAPIISPRLIASLALSACVVAGLDGAAIAAEPRRDFVIAERYLNLPVAREAAVRKVTLLIDGRVERRFRHRAGRCDPLLVGVPRREPPGGEDGDGPGRQARRRFERPSPRSTMATRSRAGKTSTASRCGRSSTSRRGAGWINDPNGLVYYRRRVSPVLPAQPLRLGVGQHALGPRRQPRPGPLGGAGRRARTPTSWGRCSAARRSSTGTNTSGFGKDGEPPLVLLYTAAGNPTVQCLAYSNDGRDLHQVRAATRSSSRSPRGNRDPKVFWHEPTRAG